MNHLEATQIELNKQERLDEIKQEFGKVVEQYNTYLRDLYPSGEYQIYHAIRKRCKTNISSLQTIKSFFDFYFRCDIAKTSREAYYVEARWMASWCMHHLMRVKLEDIAFILGYKKDHSAIIHNKKKFQEQYYIDQDFRMRFLLILEKMEDFKIDTEVLHEVLSTFEIA